VELEGEDHLPLAGDTDAVDKEIERFLSGLTSVRWGSNLDRVLATVLITDIVGSTVRAATIGDQMWKEIIAVHNDHIRWAFESGRVFSFTALEAPVVAL
jgi:hypothetical protein